MKTLIKNKNQLKKHNEMMGSKFAGTPYKNSRHEPTRYPCIVVSSINLDANGYTINHQFVYKDDF